MASITVIANWHNCIGQKGGCYANRTRYTHIQIGQAAGEMGKTRSQPHSTTDLGGQSRLNYARCRLSRFFRARAYFLFAGHRSFRTVRICLRTTIAVNTFDTIPFKTYLLISRRKMSLIICYSASPFASPWVIAISSLVSWLVLGSFGRAWLLYRHKRKCFLYLSI